jgi:hypothetical protein
MDLTNQGETEFVNSICPGVTKSAGERRQAHSHAARAAHAKARRLRTIQYQAVKADEERKNIQISEHRVITPTTRVPPTLAAFEKKLPPLPSPLSWLSSDRRDPFASFARTFLPVEHFLLDHCKSHNDIPDPEVTLLGI